MENAFNWDFFNQVPVVGILRGYSDREVRNIVAAAAEGGLRNLEITMNTDDASALIRQALKTADARMNIGAGTVCTLDDLHAALGAGACFIVMPIIDAGVIEECRRCGVPVFPGALTPNEIYQAWSLGATMVKVFPANLFGPSYIKDLKSPLDRVKLMPTGGVSLENLAAYRGHGADAFGVGSPLFPEDRVRNGQWDWIRRQCRRFAGAFQVGPQNSA